MVLATKQNQRVPGGIKFATLKFHMRTVWQDLRYGLRVLLGTPTLTAVAALTLALGIAVSTTVFGWIDGVLLHPYPGVQHTRLAVLQMVVGDGSTVAPHLSFLDYRDLRDNLKLISDIALHMQVPVSIGEGENARRVWCELVSGNYFAMLGVKPILGRVFSPDEYSDKADPQPHRHSSQEDPAPERSSSNAGLRTVWCPSRQRTR